MSFTTTTATITATTPITITATTTATTAITITGCCCSGVRRAAWILCLDDILIQRYSASRVVPASFRVLLGNHPRNAKQEAKRRKVGSVKAQFGTQTAVELLLARRFSYFDARFSVGMLCSIR